MSKRQYYIAVLTIWFTVIIGFGKEHYFITGLCAVIFFIAEIAYEINELAKTQKESAQELMRSREAIAMDTLNVLRENAKK